MPWCPKCRTEYIEGIKTCNDCESELVDVLEPQDEPLYDKEAFLVSAGGSIEADLLEVLLKSNDIPVLKKYRDAGDYMNIYMGGTIYTIDIYVPSKLLEKARDIIENLKENYSNDDIDNNSGDEADGKTYVEETSQMHAITGSDNSAEGSNEIQADLSGEETGCNRKRRIHTWIILLLFTPGLIWVLVFFILKLFD